MVEAELHQRIGQQAFRLDGVVTLFADPESSFFHPRQGRVHIRQQLRKRSIGIRGMQSRVKALAALLELGSQVSLVGGKHVASCDRLLFCG